MKTKVRKFYYEYDEKENTWAVVQEDGGHEHGQWYDAVMFYCATEQDALDAIELLIELQKLTE